MKADFVSTLDVCTEVMSEQVNDVLPITRLFRSILRLIAPMM